MSAFVGIFITGVLPISLETAVECSFPIAEALSGGVTMMSAQVFGILFIVVVSVIQDGHPHAMKSATWGLVGFVGVASVMILFFKEKDTHPKREPGHQLLKTAV
jgi:hypothetical protein